MNMSYPTSIRINDHMKTKSNYEKVEQFMDLAGQKEISRDLSTKLISFRKSLIDEEVGELQEAIEANDLHEVIDALTDILYVTYGFFKVIGVDADRAFDEVHRSNLSKFCTTHAEAKSTVEAYEEIKTYDSPVCEKRGDYWVVFNQSTGKILKSKNWSKPKFQIKML